MGRREGRVCLWKGLGKRLDQAAGKKKIPEGKMPQENERPGKGRVVRLSQ